MEIVPPEKQITERQRNAANFIKDPEMFVMPVLVIAVGILFGSILKKYL